MYAFAKKLNGKPSITQPLVKIKMRGFCGTYCFKIQKVTPSTDAKIQAMPAQCTLRINNIRQIIGLNGLFKTVAVHSLQLFSSF